MISNERPSPYQCQPYRQPYHQPISRPFVQEDTLKSEQIQIERKSFLQTLKENPRGRFLRISEEVGGKRNSIMSAPNDFLEPAGVSAMSFATRSTSQVGVDSLHGR